MSHVTISDCIKTTARQFITPGSAVGVWVSGAAYFGVTSITNPLPMNQDTLFTLGQAIPSLLLDPLRMNHSFSARYDPTPTSA